MTYKPQPADPLDLAILFATLALALCPDEIRQGMIAVLDEQITFLDEYRFDQLLERPPEAPGPRSSTPSTSPPPSPAGSRPPATTPSLP